MSSNTETSPQHPEERSPTADSRQFRRRAEDRLRSALGRSEYHAHNSPLAIIEWDAEFRIVRWSAEAERVFGWQAQETIGRSLDELGIVHEEDRERVAALSADMFAGIATRNVSRNRNYTRDGRVLFCEWYNSALHDDTGRLVSVYSEILDVTARRRAEARETRLHRVTAALSRALTPDEVAVIVLAELSAALEAESGIVGVLDDGPSRALELVAHVGFEGRELVQRVPLDAPVASPTADVLRHGTAVFVEDESAWRERFPELAERAIGNAHVSVALIPLLFEGRVAGLLGCSWRKARRLTSDERGMLSALASQCAQALERARLLQDLRHELAERERAEVEFRTLADAAPDIVFTADAEGQLLWYNERCERFTGLRVEQARTADQWMGLVHPEDRDALGVAWSRAVESGRDFEYEARWRDASGDHRWLLTRASPLRDADGRVLKWLGKSTDVHEQRNASERLAHLERLASRLASAAAPEAVAHAVLDGVASALGAAGGSVAVVSDDGQWLVRLAATGVACKAFEGDTRWPVDAALPPCEAYRQREPVVVRSSEELLARFPALAPNLERAPYEAMASWPMIAGESVVGTLCFLFDEPRAFSADECALMDAFARQGAVSLERARLYDGERGAREEAERARRVAEDANRAKSDFLAMMSHELRTPLNAISGYVELMELELRGPLTEEQRQDLARIRTAGEHLLGLINAVLNHARLEAGQLTYDIEPVRVQHLLREVEPLVRPQLTGKGLTYRCDTGDPDAVVSVDREKVRQILLNLVSNAVKFTEEGEVAITAARDGSHVAITVRDTGCGIPQEKLASIFEPFVQVDRRLNRSSEGIGLGLAISRDLARGMGGELTASSEVGVGSAFTVTLPLATLVPLERG